MDDALLNLPVDARRRLSLAFGGRDVTIPGAPRGRRFEEVAALIGQEHACDLFRSAARCRIYVPARTGQPAYGAPERALVTALAAAGARPGQIARELRAAFGRPVTVRTVRRWLSAARKANHEPKGPECRT